MDASNYGRLVERGGYATGGIILGFDGSADGASSMVAYDTVSGHIAWLEPEDPPAFVYPALGVTRDHLIGPPYYAAMWAARRARDESSIDATLRGHIERARSESRADEALSGFDGWPAAVASWEQNASTDGVTRDHMQEALYPPPSTLAAKTDMWGNAWAEVLAVACQGGKVTWVEPSGSEGYVPPRVT